MRSNNKKSPWLGSVYILNLTLFKLLVNNYFFSYNYRVINLIWQKNKKKYNKPPSGGEKNEIRESL